MVVLTDNDDVGKLEEDDTTNGSVCCPATSLRFFVYTYEHMQFIDPAHHRKDESCV